MAVTNALNSYGARNSPSTPSAFAFGARVCRIINLGKVLKIEVGVNLRRGNAGMTEHFLHRTQVPG